MNKHTCILTVNHVTRVVILFFILFLLLCTSKRDYIPQVADTITTPFQEVGRSTLYYYDGNRLLFKLNSDYTHKNLTDSDTCKMLMVPVRITIYDSLDAKKITKVLADSGNTSNTLDNYFIWGNVYIKHTNGLIIKSQTLWWNKKIRKVGSDDFVEIKTPDGDILRGKGFDSDDEFNDWSLRQQVSGKFPNFKKQIETNEESK